MINLSKSVRKTNQFYIVTIYDNITDNTIERITDYKHLKTCLNNIMQEFNIKPNKENSYGFCCNKADFCEDGYLVKSTYVCSSTSYQNN